MAIQRVFRRAVRRKIFIKAHSVFSYEYIFQTRPTNIRLPRSRPRTNSLVNDLPRLQSILKTHHLSPVTCHSSPFTSITPLLDRAVHLGQFNEKPLQFFFVIRFRQAALAADQLRNLAFQTSAVTHEFGYGRVG